MRFDSDWIIDSEGTAFDERFVNNIIRIVIYSRPGDDVDVSHKIAVPVEELSSGCVGCPCSPTNILGSGGSCGCGNVAVDAKVQDSADVAVGHRQRVFHKQHGRQFFCRREHYHGG